MPREVPKEKARFLPSLRFVGAGIFPCQHGGCRGGRAGAAVRSGSVWAAGPHGQQGQGTRVNLCWGPQQVLCWRSAAPQGVGQGFQGGFYTGIWSSGAAPP